MILELVAARVPQFRSDQLVVVAEHPFRRTGSIDQEGIGSPAPEARGQTIARHQRATYPCCSKMQT